MKRVLMPIGILLGSIVVAVVLIRNPTRVSESAPEIIPISVRVAEVQTESVQLFIESQGKAQAARQARVSSKLQGTVAWVFPSFAAGAYGMVGDRVVVLGQRGF